MASSEKTPNLLLNKWLGSDSPKREDFVTDNMILDAAITELKQNAGQGGGQDPRLDAHLGNAAVHMSPTEKQTLANSVPVIGTYTGNGALFQSIVLGFRPRYGFVFTENEPFLMPGATGTSLTVRAAMITDQGCTEGVDVISTGFRGYQMDAPSQNGQTHVGMNKNSQKYIYMMWR